jgi:hypothetical protein
MRRACIATLLGAAACALRDVPGPPGQEQVVVQGVLSAHTAEQVLWIEHTTPAGEPVGTALQPLAIPPTRIEVRDSTGAVFTFQVDAANPARFLASFTPTPGWRYDLLLEAGAHVLTASTRVPGVVTIVNPATDTIVWSPTSTLPLTWSGPIRRVRVSYADTTGRGAYEIPTWVTADTVIQLRYFPPVPAIQIWVLAVDSVTARVADPFASGFDPASFGQLRGNVTGGAGFFGAATADRVIVRLE